MRTEQGLREFAALLEAHQTARFRKQYPSLAPEPVRIKPGPRWYKVDVGTSGKYVVDTDGTIYGIKGYGVPHYGHCYGTLDTIRDWDWSGYVAVRLPAPVSA